MPFLRATFAWFVQLALTALLLLVLWLLIDPDEFGRAVSGAQAEWLLLAVAFNLLSDVFRGARWRALLADDCREGVLTLTAILVLSLGLNAAAPLRAGDLARVQILGRRGVARMTVLGTLAAERLLDFVTFALLLASATVAGAGRAVNLATLAYAGLVLLALLAAVVVGRRADSTNAPPTESAGISGAVRRQLNAFARGLRTLARPRLAALAFLFSMLGWTCETLVYFFVAQALGIDASAGALLVVVVVANTVVAVPLTQASVGPYELSVTAVLSQYGVGRSASAAYAVLVHAVLVVPVVIAAALALWFLRIRPRDLLYLRAERTVRGHGGEAG